MVLTIIESQLLIKTFNNININQQVKMAAPINCVLSQFEGNINHVDTTGLRLYLQSIKKIDKEAEKLDISV